MKKRLVGGKIGESRILCAGSLLVGFCQFAWANPLMVSLSDKLEIGRKPSGNRCNRGDPDSSVAPTTAPALWKGHFGSKLFLMTLS